MRANPPDPAKIQRGTEARKQRFEAAITKFAVRIDEDILEQFNQLVPPGEMSEELINQALREWLSVRGVKELVHAELQQALQMMLSAIQVGAGSKLEKSVAVEEG
jgi:Arc/MetJ-type ribon-helix-helix transcriptional regulator